MPADDDEMRVALLSALALASAVSRAQAPAPDSAIAGPTATEADAMARAAEIAAAGGASAGDAASGAGAASQDGRKLVAVLDLRPSGETAAPTATAMTTMLTAEITALPGFRSISRNEIKSVLAHQADAMLAGCNEPRCAADVAELVKADLIIAGELSVVADATVVTLSLIDVAGEGGPQVVARQDASFRGAESDVLLLARPLAQRLLDGPNAQNHTGVLEVFTHSGATIIVDGKEVGVAPAPALRDLPTGVHTLEVQQAGHLPAKLDVIVSRNETTISRVELMEEALTDQPWFWAAAGGVVLLAGGTAAGITTWAMLSQEKPTRVTLGKLPN